MKITKSQLKQIIKEELSKAGAYEALKNAFTTAGYEYLEKESQAGPDEWGFGVPHLSFTKPGTKNPYDGSDSYPPIIQITVDEEVGKMYVQLHLRAPESDGARAGKVIDKRPARDGGYYRGHKDAIDLSDFGSLEQRIDHLFQGIPKQVARRVDSEAEVEDARAAAERGVGSPEWRDLEEKKMRLTKSKLKQIIKEEIAKIRETSPHVVSGRGWSQEPPEATSGPVMDDNGGKGWSTEQEAANALDMKALQAAAAEQGRPLGYIYPARAGEGKWVIVHQPM